MVIDLKMFVRHNYTARGFIWVLTTNPSVAFSILPSLALFSYKRDESGLSINPSVPLVPYHKDPSGLGSLSNCICHFDRILCQWEVVYSVVGLVPTDNLELFLLSIEFHLTMNYTAYSVLMRLLHDMYAILSLLPVVEPSPTWASMWSNDETEVRLCWFPSPCHPSPCLIVDHTLVVRDALLRGVEVWRNRGDQQWPSLLARCLCERGRK